MAADLLELGVRQRLAGRVPALRAEVVLGPLERDAVARADRVEDLECLGGDLGTDPVATDDGQLEGLVVLTSWVLPRCRGGSWPLGLAWVSAWRGAGRRRRAALRSRPSTTSSWPDTCRTCCSPVWSGAVTNGRRLALPGGRYAEPAPGRSALADPGAAANKTYRELHDGSKILWHPTISPQCGQLVPEYEIPVTVTGPKLCNSQPVSAPPELPPLVSAALSLSGRRGFVSSTRNETGRLLATLAASRTGPARRARDRLRRRLGLAAQRRRRRHDDRHRRERSAARAGGRGAVRRRRAGSRSSPPTGPR